ncbi:hypothetical protein [Acinetobacter wuhouensis]|uniref:hypothetical protein n=1 Tax=Acinetobacter wuhouensis TaxID=1879050 RepID=UPI0013EE3FFE|nr:hypothetical protein [Acinetobacter wuhouensis]
MNFNLDLKVDKAMNQLSQSKTLRVWSYIIIFLLIVGVFIWQLASILQAIAKIIEALK